MVWFYLKGLMPDSRDIQRWIEYAENDWVSAVSLLGSVATTPSFLFHESIEKYLKAVILLESKQLERSHDLMDLLSRIPQAPSEDSLEMNAAKILDLSFGVSRYPDRGLEITLEDSQSIYRAGLVLRALARERLGLEML